MGEEQPLIATQKRERRNLTEVSIYEPHKNVIDGKYAAIAFVPIVVAVVANPTTAAILSGLQNLRTHKVQLFIIWQQNTSD